MILYDPDQVCGFRFTRDEWGPFSNFSNHHVDLFGVRWKNSEALYQAARFPARSDLQLAILEASNASAAKSIAQQNYPETVAGWDKRRIDVMWITLIAKMQTHPELFKQLFAKSGKRPIVEISKRDDYWGAKPLPNGNLLGLNTLGRLWMMLRDESELVEYLWVDKNLSLMPYYNPNTLEKFSA